MTGPAPGETDRIRLDKWLFFARFARSRTLAARLVSDGCVRLNTVKVETPARPVRPGDVLTLALPHAVRVVRVEACGSRRGPASEAATLFVDVAPPVPVARTAPLPGKPLREPGSGRPTKRDRRATDRLLKGG